MESRCPHARITHAHHPARCESDASIQAARRVPTSRALSRVLHADSPGRPPPPARPPLAPLPAVTAAMSAQ
jgi:hypothetical protein